LYDSLWAYNVDFIPYAHYLANLWAQTKQIASSMPKHF